MKTKTFRKLLLGISASALSCMMVLAGILPNFRDAENSASRPDKETAENAEIVNVTGKAGVDLRDFLNESVTQKLPESVSSDREISVMLALGEQTLLDGYNALGDTSMTLADYSVSREGRSIVSRIERESRALQNRLTRAGVKYDVGVSYDTLIGGFEAVIRASEFDKLQEAVGKSANVIISEEYAPSEYYPSEKKENEIVENDVNVHDTGIFDTTGSQYDGSGTVVAVLDTGVDYTHPAFDVKNFTGKEVITQDSISTVVNNLKAKSTTPNLTASDVYVNKKIPFAYDYADGDPDVYPINADHGTHVSGIVVGLDDTIRGVAPNAQLVFMKTFSEFNASAKQSWIVAALEDCVMLKVDVINMSLGSASGFAREVDEKQHMEIFDLVRDSGITLVAAGGNDASSSQGSLKNGSLTLTTNPDTGLVGAPSSYAGALSVASISGVKTSYITFKGKIIYFHEATGASLEPLDFVDDILEDNETERDFEYVIIDGVGASVNYNNVDVKGKIALVKRGVTNFEDKIRLAQNAGAAGIIIYNNVSGEIQMTIGTVVFPACSISRDDAQPLLDAGDGERIIKISRSQKAGPFMSTFSSWGPTPDLGIKPEITAHGGDILSCIPGGRYDRYSGTSMASPNQAGLTLLVRQYVKEKFPNYTAQEVTAMTNQLMMSTADIAYNTNSLPFAVRRQGAGLANLDKATSTPAYIRTYDRYNPTEILDKAKLELGDDPQKTGVYNMKFQVVNISDSAVNYNVDAFAMTEGLAEMFTVRGDITVDEKGYELSDITTTVKSISNGSQSGNKITVQAHQTAEVEFEMRLGEEDIAYLTQKSNSGNVIFANGIYVEGYVRLTGTDGTSVNLNVPYLSFYGDWTQAPILDLDWFETNPTEINNSIPDDDKVLPDTAATRAVGKLYGDYITYLGGIPYTSDPNSTLLVPADRDKIALTNQDGEYGGVNGIDSIAAGFLRAAKYTTVVITDDATGEVIWQTESWNKIKSIYSGGGHIPISVDVDFLMRDFDLKNNSKYNVLFTAYLDYGTPGDPNYGGLQTNLRNTFEFPFYADFESPIATGVEYTYEYDRTTRTNRLFANISIYDNHYTMGYIAGTMERNTDYDRTDPDSYLYNMNTFDYYITPVISQRNSTSVIKVDLTDHLDEIRQSHDGRSFMIQTMDYALNNASYEFRLPDNIKEIVFDEMTPDENGNKGVTISPNELYRLIPRIEPSEDEAWYETLIYTSSNESVVKVVNGQLLGIGPGTATVTAQSAADENVKQYLDVTVLAEGEPGYTRYDKPYAENFSLRGYTVNKVYYRMNSDDRDLRVDKATKENGDPQYVTLGSGKSFAFSMFPSESITVDPLIDGYQDASRYVVKYSSSNDSVVEVKEDGTITAKNVDADGKGLNTDMSASISVTLYMQNDQGELEMTGEALSIYVNVKKPYITNATPYLYNYYGLGGEVEIPADLRLTEIYDFAFSNYEYVDKDPAEGDVIDDEDPYSMKQWYIGENTITKVIVPEGVEVIDRYAFAGLTALKEVVLPSTLYKLQVGAFRGCTSLTTITFSGANNLQFINADCFKDCTNLNNIKFDSIIGIGDGAFENAGLMQVDLPKSAQSIAANAFLNNTSMTTLNLQADLIKLGANAFENCNRLESIVINANVIPDGAFEECTNLKNVTIGKDVQVIGQNAFRHTAVSNFNVVEGNTVFETGNASGGNYLIEKATGKLALVAPTVTTFSVSDRNITTIGTGAFSTASNNLKSVTLSNVTVVEDYALANCAALRNLTLGTLTYVGSHAFYGDTALSTLPTLQGGSDTFIGEYAFASTGLTNVTIPAEIAIGNYAFADNKSMSTVKIENNATIGDYAFYGSYNLKTVTIGDDVTIGERAFSGIASGEYMEKIGHGGKLAEYFYSGKSTSYNSQNVNTTVIPALSAINSLSIGKNAVIGDYAFYSAGSGDYNYSYTVTTNGNEQTKSEKYTGGSLTSVTLGEGATIGNYAFFGCKNLKTIDLSKAKAIGDYAFAGSMTEYLLFSGGETIIISEIYTAAPIENINISAVETLGVGAFRDNAAVTTVTLGGLENLPDETFANCPKLNSVNLSGLSVIGKDAFSGSALTSVSFKEGVEIDDGAFDSNTKLATASGLDKVAAIGARAFYGTALTEANISSAKRLGDFAFATSKVKSVTLSEELTDLGENPFADCDIPEFTRGNDGKTKTFDLAGGIVKVVNGVLYRTKTNGLEIITYPMGKADKEFTIEEDTVRVGAQAFLNAKVSIVTIPRAVRAIGDKAFYGCTSLTAVNFRSLNAPRLEEAYDYRYDNAIDEKGLNIYVQDSVGDVDVGFRDGTTFNTGKKFVPFKMWGYSATTVLYGANFVYDITNEAHKTHTLVMVRPKNGTGYESFNYMCYFDSSVLGADTLTDQGAIVLGLIKTLPSAMDLTADDYDRVTEIYNMYDALLDSDKTILQADGYAEILLNAKSIVDTYKPATPTDSNTEEEGKTDLTWLWYLLVAVAGIAIGAFVAYLIAGRKKSEEDDASADKSNENTEKSQEEKSENKSDNE